MDSDLTRTFQRLSKREASDLRKANGKDASTAADLSQNAHESGTCDDSCPHCSD